MSCTIRGEFPIYFAHYPLQGKKLQLAAIYFLNLKTKHIAAVISFLCICPLKATHQYFLLKTLFPLLSSLEWKTIRDIRQCFEIPINIVDFFILLLKFVY
jgi:hypothetical protein